MNQFLSKDEKTDQFLRLYLAHQSRIYSFILTIVSNWIDAEEIFQETTMVMWKRFDEFEPDSNFAAWGMKIARFKVMDYRKKKAPLTMDFSEDLLDAIMMQASKDDHLETERRLDMLRSCLGKLREGDRRLIRLRYRNKTTTADLARQLGRPAMGLYKVMARIHATLQECVRRSLLAEERTS